MKKFDVDIIWLIDAQLMDGEMKTYIPHIQKQLPNSRTYLFPTTVSSTNSNNESNARMGRTMAIVIYKWRKFVLDMYTYLIKLEIFCVLNVKIESICLRTVSIYFSTKSLGTGSITFISRIQQSLHTDTLSPESQRDDFTQFVKDLTQNCISKVRIKR
jgi:hypothetical protein